MTTRLVSLLFAALIITAPALASADIASVWIAAKGSHLKGTGSVFDNIDKDLAFGLEAGVELLNLELMLEAFLMGEDQYVFTGNFGMDFSLELGVRASVGAYLGVILFKMAEPEDSGFALSNDLKSSLDQIQDGLSTTIEDSYNDQYGEQANSLSQWALGVGPRV
jgi:hypothetical protein